MTVGEVQFESYLATVVLQFALADETRLLLDQWMFLGTQPIGMRTAIVRSSLLVHHWYIRAVR